MEPEGSLPHWQVSATCSYPELDLELGFPTKTLYTPLLSPIRATWSIPLKMSIVPQIFLFIPGEGCVVHP